MSIRIALADDHPIVLDGLELLFGMEQDFEIVARCINGEEAIEAVREHRPDVLVVDLRMPVRDGLAVMRELAREESTAKIVVLTAALDEDEVLEAIRLGARGVVLKEMAPRLLIQCVRAVAAGARWVDRELLGRAADRAALRPAATTDSLTPRELDVVRLVARGLRNKEIAEQLEITPGTVKIHLHSIYEKLQIGGRAELSLLARENGLA